MGYPTLQKGNKYAVGYIKLHHIFYRFKIGQNFACKKGGKNAALVVIVIKIKLSTL